MLESDLTDPVAAAQAARLRYLPDSRPGIRREQQGDEVVYLGVDGQPITNGEKLARLQALAIPPAWTGVWISPLPHGHLQATGRDAKGRKQYRYHPRWRAIRDETKYHRMIAFGQALPLIRERVRHDLGLRGLPRAKVLATVVQLMDDTALRVGNEEYARENHSYGLTTLGNEHVDVSGATLHFHFTGKGGKNFVVDVRDRRLARIVKRCQELPGHELFQYVDEDGERYSIDSSDLNEYLREISGEDFTAKDFRTWHGTVVATCTLRACGAAETATQASHNVVQAIKSAAEYLGNTPAICRKSYVYPAVVDTYLAGSLLELLAQAASLAADEPAGLSREEREVLAVLRRLEQAREDKCTRGAA